MKVLWLSPSSSNYLQNNVYNGGGWISSLENYVSKNNEVKLAVAFFMDNQPYKVERNNVVYYPIEKPHLGFRKKILFYLKIWDNTVDRLIWPLYEKSILNVVNDFQPDIIQVFGSENYFGLVSRITSIPIVLHIQGFLNPCLNSFCPPRFSLNSFYFSNYNLINAYKRFMAIVAWNRTCFREKIILRGINHYIGRTRWDKRIVEVFNPFGHYYYGGEILRPSFYEILERKIPAKVVLVSIISKSLYKGYDMILKTASVLKDELKMDFEWKVFGNINGHFEERIVGLKHNNLNIKLCGIATEMQLRNELINCSLYFHPSYIENSPNSICEAQILGVPVIATNVGGVSSLIEDGETGYLVPANDPYQASSIISFLINNPSILCRVGESARKVAHARHNPQIIVEKLINTWNFIINKENY